MKIVSWNVNSVRARYDRLLNWVEQNEPDVLCLQELKCVDGQFPHDELGELGYYAETLGQKTYNGVAIIARDEITGVIRNMQDGVDDPQARLIAGTVEGVRIVCVYCPNGGTMGSEKWRYKLEWYKRLRTWLDTHCDPSQPTVLLGDFNVAPEARDIARPDLWGAGVLCVPEARAALQNIVDWGFVDTYRMHEQGAKYSWWDYRANGFYKNDGLRIDMVYATQGLAATCTAVGIDKAEREEVEGDKPSDHAPIWAEFTGSR